MPEQSRDSETGQFRWASAKADFEQKGFAVAGAIDDKPETGWAIDPARGNSHVAQFEIAADQKLPPGAMLTFTIEQSHSDTHTIGKFRLSVANAIPERFNRKSIPSETDTNPDTQSNFASKICHVAGSCHDGRG